jgi:hypothetical protein
MNRRHFTCVDIAVALLVLAPTALFAQSGIAGVVKDTSNAVLPGVTVEAASPALIEKVRAGVTDSDGSYRILDLRPGVYSVTFSLPGFSTVKREGVQLPPAFTATVSVELAVGAIEETVTVSGAAPLVDVQNATSQRRLSPELLDTLPAARSPQGFTALTPGVISQGLGGIPGGRNEQNTASHGAPTNESVYAIDGVSMANTNGPGGGSSNTRMPQSYVAEINIVTGGGTAEQPLSGTLTNVIPKEGGNTFAGTIYSAYSTAGWSQNNLTPALSAMGFSGNSLSNLRKLWDFQPAFGGRIKRDKLWFFASYRMSGTILTRAGVFDNLTPRGWAYTPDLNRPALNKLTTGSKNLRLTWQVSPKNKISLFSDFEPIITYNHGYETPKSPETNPYTPYRPNGYSIAKWSSPVSSRLLFEVVGLNQSVDNNKRRQTPATCFCSAPAIGYDVISAVETTTGIIFRADSNVATGGSNYMHASRHSIRYAGTSSYVTASHAVKAGLQFVHGRQFTLEENNGSIAYSLRNGAPISLTQYAMPFHYQDVIHQDLGLFIQDQWTRKRLTLTGGVRYDYYNGGAAAEHLDAGFWVPARDFPATTRSPLWKDVNPRIAASFDLFGDGKTAVKASAGRFVKGVGASALSGLNPVIRSVLSVTRNWADANGNFSPDCDLKDPLLNGECGRISNLNFGQNNPNAVQYAPELLTGLRPYNWETTTVIERQLMTGVSVTLGYYHKVFKGFTVSDNLLVTPADYSTYCITAPVDARLPGGGGNQICGLYDVSPALFGQSQALVKPVTDYRTGYDGFDILQSVRMAGGVTISGGINIQRTTSNTCVVVDSPAGPPVPGLPASSVNPSSYCKVTPPMQPNATYVGSVPLPWWGLLTSATYRDYPGAQILATYQVTNAQIAPSLKRDLSSGANGTVNVELIKPGTMYGSRQRQLDARVSKRFRFVKYRAVANLDIFNLLNVNSPETIVPTWGPNWQRPTQLQQGRYVKLSGQFDF